MSGSWRALEEIAEFGWHDKLREAVLSGPFVADVVTGNLDLLITATSRAEGQYLDAAVRLLKAAADVVDPRSETGIRLRLQQGVLLGTRGAYLEADSVLEDTYIDARRTDSRWATELLANLAVLGLLRGDRRTAERWLAKAESPGSSASAVLLASVRAALGRYDLGSAGVKGVRAQQVKAVQQHISQAGPSVPTSLVAVADLAVNDFHAALAAGRTEEAARILESLELTLQRISAHFGADHPQTVTVQLNYAAAEFSLNRELCQASRAQHSLLALRSATLKLSSALPAGHPQALVAGSALDAAEFEAARLSRSTSRAVRAFALMTDSVGAMTAALGELHPQVLTAMVNLATAGFELARAKSTPVQLETALRTLEDAHDRARAVLGAEHGTTRVLQHELTLCRQLVFGTDEGGGGEGSVLTRQRTAVPAPFEPFERDYIPIDQAGEVLRWRRGRVALAEHERLSALPPELLGEDPPLTPQCCGPVPPGGLILHNLVEDNVVHNADCPNHPDNIAEDGPDT